MKNYIKNHGKILLFATGILLSHKAFSASEATKKLIHETLAKYGISAGGKEVCGRSDEPICDKLGCKVKCNRVDATTGLKANNYWSPKDRLCKSCPLGTVLNKQTFQTCNQVVCPEGTTGIKVSGGKCPAGMDLFAPSKGICPEGYELKKITNGKCPDGFELIDLRSNCPSGFEMFKQS